MKIVVDTSALLAILRDEPERAALEAMLLESDPAISAATVVETLRVVQTSFGPDRLDRIHALLAAYGVEIIPVDRDQVRLAQEGMVRFGKGRKAPPAVLNFGDLFAYALARRLSAPLLYKGGDFAATDVMRLPDRPSGGPP